MDKVKLNLPDCFYSDCQELADAEIEIYQFPDCDSDEDDDFKEQNEKLKHSLPFALVGIAHLLKMRIYRNCTHKCRQRENRLKTLPYQGGSQHRS